MSAAPNWGGWHQLEAERRANIRAAYRHLIALGEVEAVADAVWRLTLYWWIRSYLPEAKTWTEEVLDVGVTVSTRTRAIALAFPSWVSLWQTDAEISTEDLERSVELFHETGDVFSEGLTLTVLSLAYMSVEPPDLALAEQRQLAALELVDVQRDATFHALFIGALGRIRLLRGHPREGMELLEASRVEASHAGDIFAESVALTQIGWARLALGDPDPDPFLRNLELALRLGNDVGVAFALEGLGATAVQTGDPERGGELLGAAENLRTRTGLWDQRAFITFQPYVDAVLAGEASAEFEAAHARGRRMPRRAVLELALGSVAPAVEPRAVRRRSRLPHPGAGLPASPRGQWAAWGPGHDAPGGRRRRHHDRRLGCSRHPHPRPATPGLREPHPQGAGPERRAAARHRAPAPRARDVRARRPSPSAALPLSGLPGAERRLRRPYWQQYGWIAPDEAISGLEDEYRLAGDRPSSSTSRRRPPNAGRASRASSAGSGPTTASYKAFSTAQEPQSSSRPTSHLLAVRFDASRSNIDGEGDNLSVKGGVRRRRGGPTPRAFRRRCSAARRTSDAARVARRR